MLFQEHGKFSQEYRLYAFCHKSLSNFYFLGSFSSLSLNCDCDDQRVLFFSKKSIKISFSSSDNFLFSTCSSAILLVFICMRKKVRIETWTLYFNWLKRIMLQIIVLHVGTRANFYNIHLQYVKTFAANNKNKLIWHYFVVAATNFSIKNYFATKKYIGDTRDSGGL